jgi:TusA-related sulfurtransferase/rhodanese-related sulfurtransferase
MSIKADVQLDAKGLACPMPIVKTKKAMKEIAEGKILEITATDKGSKADLAAWAESAGHEYIGTNEDGEILIHYIRKGGADSKADKPFEQTVTNEDLATIEGIILDVREEAEYAFGHVPQAKSIPLGELEKRMIELDPNQDIYVICRTGRRSELAAHKLAQSGFQRVYNVLPGMKDWKVELVKETNR